MIPTKDLFLRSDDEGFIPFYELNNRVKYEDDEAEDEQDFDEPDEDIEEED